MSVEFQKSISLYAFAAFNKAGNAISSASWGSVNDGWGDSSVTYLGYAGVRAQSNIRYAFAYAFTTPTWDGDIIKLTLVFPLTEELGSSRTIRWSVTSTNPMYSNTMYTGQDLEADSGRIDDGTIEVTGGTEAQYTVELSLSSLAQNTVYFLVLSPYTTPSGTSNYISVKNKTSAASLLTGYVTYEAEASEVNVPDGTIGTAITITMTNDGLSKTLTYEFEGATGTIVSGTTASSVSWTPPMSLCNQIPNDTSGTLTITCTTAAGETTDTATLVVPASVKPYISSANTSIEPSNDDSTVAGWNIYLQNWSKIRLQISSRATYSAKIVSWRFTSAAVTIEGTASSVSISIDTLSDILTAAGVYSGTVTVTDSRGRTTTLSLGSFTVVAYTAPTAVDYAIYRCLQNGTRDDAEGTYLYCIATKSYSQVGNNSCSMQFQYKLTTASNYTSVSLSDGVALITGNGNIDILKSYNARIAITDSLTTTYISVTISTQETPFNMKPSIASGVGFGGYAQEDRIVELFNLWKLRVPSDESILVYASDGVTVKTLKQLIEAGGGGSGGTTDYNDLINKPVINGHTMSGSVSLANIGCVTTVSSASTDVQFPSAKCVYDIIGDIETLLASL